ncbi:MAG: hypothetical protein JWL83_2989 [Actinomycetia bacterium]|nr:hypothetical protein [Actinomycetes bacterium]
MVARWLAGSMVWGVLLAYAYDASVVHGALVGLWAWGPAIVLAFRWRDVTEDAPLDAFGP